MKKEIIDQAMENGLFQIFKNLRDMTMKPETPIHIKYGGTGLKIMSNKLDNLRYAEHSDGWIEVINKDFELLGVIYNYKKWNKWVWEQCPGIIMAQDCLKTIDKIIIKYKEV